MALGVTKPLHEDAKMQRKIPKLMGEYLLENYLAQTWRSCQHPGSWWILMKLWMSLAVRFWTVRGRCLPVERGQFAMTFLSCNHFCVTRFTCLLYGKLVIFILWTWKENMQIKIIWSIFKSCHTVLEAHNLLTSRLHPSSVSRSACQTICNGIFSPS